MPDQERKRVGAYAKLLANYASDDALIAAGEAAELLFVRGLAFCATSDADGYITDAQVVRIVGAGMRDAMKRANRLAEVGVWERVEGGFIVRSWLKIHESSEQKGRRKKADRERKRAGLHKDSERNPSGGTPDSLSVIQSSTRQDTAVQVDSSLGGERPEPSEPAAVTQPPQKRSRCTKHPNGNPTDEPCSGCRADRELDDKRAARAAERAARAAEEAARNCTRCDGTWEVDPETALPTRRRCAHSSRRTA